MSTVLNNPLVETKTIDKVQITRIDNNIEEGYIEISYLTLYDNNTPAQRGIVGVKGYDAVKALYTETDILIATGKTFEEASTEILYAKVVAQLEL